jgi:hypothetical protein
MNPYTKTNFGNTHSKLLNPLSANEITQTTLTYFWDYFGDYFFKSSKKSSKLFIIFKILLCQSLCKGFQNICNFQKFQILFISPFNAKKTCVIVFNECLMSAFESLLFIGYFSN